MATLLTVAPTRAAGWPLSRSAVGVVGSGGASAGRAASDSGFCERVTGAAGVGATADRAGGSWIGGAPSAVPQCGWAAHPQAVSASATTAEPVRQCLDIPRPSGGP